MRAAERSADAALEHRQPVKNRAPLEPTPYVRLPIGAVRAGGWLERQLRLQTTGLTGASERLYDALQADSGWLGGDGEGWEKTPYYVKGLVALAYTLDDAKLQQRAQKWIDWTLESQTPDGFFGPASNNDWWPRMVALFYLRDYHHATGDDRVLPFMLRYFRHQLEALPERPLQDWGRARAGDNLDVVLWTYNLTGQEFLLELAELLGEQAYPWPSIYTENRFYDFGTDFHPHHIVNVSQALKTPAVLWQVNHQQATRDAFGAGVRNLQRQYGRVDGQVSGTEMLSGLRSTDGVELCADVERILSNAIALTILGDAELGDQLEKVAYNSFPAHTSADLSQITYYQFPNQIACTKERHGFQQDYANANLPGPHSGFPCCCYNWHFGWPKLVQHMWAATDDDGLALLVYGPNRVEATVRGGTAVTVTQTTDYPFQETVSLAVEPARTATFPLVLRVPGWCESPRVTVNGSDAAGVRAGEFYRLERAWSPGDRVEVSLPMRVRTSAWVNNSVALERGPLAFSLKIDEQWSRVHDYADRFDEYEIRPGSAWNYALRVDRDSPKVEVVMNPVPPKPFATESAPVVLRVPAQRVPGWGRRSRPGRVVIGRADNGWSQLATADTPLEPGEPHRLQIESRNGRVSVFLDDQTQPLIVREDLRVEGGAVGLRSYETTASFRDIRLNGQATEVSAGSSMNGWTTHGGDWSVEDGQLRVAVSRSGKALWNTPLPDGDFTLEAVLTAEAGGNAGLIFGVSNATDRLDGYQGFYVGLECAEGKSEDSAEPPTSPVHPDTPVETVELIPFGSTKLRVSYFPVAE